MKRFIIRAVRTSEGWNVTLSAAGASAPLHSHRLRSLEARGLSFPQPAEPPLDANAPHFRLCTTTEVRDISSALDDLRLRPVPSGTAIAVGRYLFDLLFGAAGWERVIDCAASESIELALCWTAMDHALRSLPWEMLYGPNGFLSADIERRIAITRLTPSPAKDIEPLPAPLKVLFVVGGMTEKAPIGPGAEYLGEASIRPGAEYLGLLRHLNEQMMAQDSNNAGLNSRLLLQATSEQVEQEIKRFAPSVVHYICHGNMERNDGVTRGFLLLAPASGEKEPTKLYADALLRLIAGTRSQDTGQALPIVVLNACKTAAYDKAKETLPLAAELIAGGVPMVVGMAGEVSDQACRLFTRRFYEALVHGQSVVDATAEGRLAGVLHRGGPTTENLDWALPTLFLAENVSPQIRVDPATGDAWSKLRRIARKYSSIHNPMMLCGRFDVVDEAYQSLLRAASGGIITALALCVPERDPQIPSPQYGKTRLLEQLAAQAVRDGCLPCLTTFREGETVPGQLLEVAIRIFQDMLTTRERFQLDKEPRSAVLDYAEAVVRLAGTAYAASIAQYRLRLDVLTRQVRDLRADAIGIDNVAAIRDALCKDLISLKNDAQASYPGAQPLVLVDDVHRFGAATGKFLQMVDVEGLGEPMSPIGVVLTCSRGLKEVGYETAMKELKEFWEKKLPYVCYVELKAFGHPANDPIPYQQFLLTFDPPFVIRPGVSPENLDEWLDLLNDYIKGVPSKMKMGDPANDGVIGVVRAGKPVGIVREAKDDDALKAIGQQIHGEIRL